MGISENIRGVLCQTGCFTLNRCCVTPSRRYLTEIAPLQRPFYTGQCIIDNSFSL
jgi:hypothetical protein